MTTSAYTVAISKFPPRRRTLPWAAVENQVQYLIWAILGIPENQGKLLTAALRFETHMSVLAVVGPSSAKLSECHKNTLAYIKTEALRLLSLRNTVVHASWVPGEDLLLPEAYRMRAKDDTPRIAYSVESIEAIALDINNLMRLNLLLLLEMTDPAPPSSP